MPLQVHHYVASSKLRARIFVDYLSRFFEDSCRKCFRVLRVEVSSFMSMGFMLYR